jgi:hypothetical protein
LVVKTDTHSTCITIFTMNIFVALRSRSPVDRSHLINQVRNYIDDDGFAGILETIDVNSITSIREACRDLNIYMNVPYIRPRVNAWLKGYKA